MLHLITYDIADSRRLNRVARVCENYGLRVQKSVFECYLERVTFIRLWEELVKIVKVEEGDKIIAYPIAASEQKNIKTLGISDAGVHSEIYIF